MSEKTDELFAKKEQVDFGKFLQNFLEQHALKTTKIDIPFAPGKTMTITITEAPGSTNARTRK